jgi:hypothetical protein
MHLVRGQAGAGNRFLNDRGPQVQGDTPAKVPEKPPMAVLTALTITTSRIPAASQLLPLATVFFTKKNVSACKGLSNLFASRIRLTMQNSFPSRMMSRPGAGRFHLSGDKAKVFSRVILPEIRAGFSLPALSCGQARKWAEPLPEGGRLLPADVHAFGQRG